LRKPAKPVAAFILRPNEKAAPPGVERQLASSGPPGCGSGIEVGAVPVDRTCTGTPYSWFLNTDLVLQCREIAMLHGDLRLLPLIDGLLLNLRSNQRVVIRNGSVIVP